MFDGSAVMEIVEEPASSSLRDKILRHNKTHVIKTQYSEDGSVIGPTAADFFPNSPWVKFRFVPDVGHFLHMEAPGDCISSLQELLNVPDAHAELPWYA